MKYMEYGDASLPTIILLHGGGLNTWNYRKAAYILKTWYHVVLPVLDGHAGSDKPFTTIEENAGEIIDYMDTNLDSVLLIGGLSLGAQIALEILSLRKDICKHALIESAAVIPSKLTNALIGPAFGSSYGLIKNKSFAKLQFKSLRMDDDYFDEYYRDTCAIKKSDMIAFMKASTGYALKEDIKNTIASVHIFAGEKENREILDSAMQIHQMIPSGKLLILKGLYHGEFSLNHPQQYADRVIQIIER
ncbi:MAG: alpha/beta hydrolase [Faecalicoccus sp.]|nr:alpha/beta hydrolase [Faecalicoccus sp.]